MISNNVFSVNRLTLSYGDHVNVEEIRNNKNGYKVLSNTFNIKCPCKTKKNQQTLEIFYLNITQALLGIDISKQDCYPNLPIRPDVSGEGDHQ